MQNSLNFIAHFLCEPWKSTLCYKQKPAHFFFFGGGGECRWEIKLGKGLFFSSPPSFPPPYFPFSAQKNEPARRLWENSPAAPESHTGRWSDKQTDEDQLTDWLTGR